MKSRLRCYWFKEDGNIKRVSLAFAKALYEHDARYIEHANTTMRLLYVHYSIENKIPISLNSVNGIVVKFDAEGSPYETTFKKLGMILESLPVLSPESEDQKTRRMFIDKKLDRLSWNPTEKELADVWQIISYSNKTKTNKIVEFPSQQNKIQESVKPMEHNIMEDVEIEKDIAEMKDKIADVLALIDTASSKFINKSFHVVATQIIPKLETETEKLLWHGVKSALKHERGRDKRWERGDGDWVAVVYLLRWNDWRKGEASGETIEVVTCASKKDAVAALKKMVVRHAMKIDDLSYIETEIVPADEWREENNPKPEATE